MILPGRMSRENTTGRPSAVRTRSTTSTSWPGSSPRRSASPADAGPVHTRPCSVPACIPAARIASETPKFSSRLLATRVRSATYVPDPQRRRTSPCPSRARSASRRVARDTPNSAASSGSEGRRVPAVPLGQLALNRYRPQPRTLPWHLPLPVHVREYSSDNLASSSGPHLGHARQLEHEKGNRRPLWLL